MPAPRNTWRPHVRSLGALRGSPHAPDTLLHDGTDPASATALRPRCATCACVGRRGSGCQGDLTPGWAGPRSSRGPARHRVTFGNIRARHRALLKTPLQATTRSAMPTTITTPPIPSARTPSTSMSRSVGRLSTVRAPRSRFLDESATASVVAEGVENARNVFTVSEGDRLSPVQTVEAR